MLQHPEIVKAIIDNVREVSGGHFRAPLKSCALVSKVWLPQSQRHLFHHVRLQHGTELRRWCKNIAKGRVKVLSTYVKWLNYSPPRTKTFSNGSPISLASKPSASSRLTFWNSRRKGCFDPLLVTLGTPCGTRHRPLCRPFSCPHILFKSLPKLHALGCTPLHSPLRDFTVIRRYDQRV